MARGGTRIRTGWAALLALGLVAACGNPDIPDVTCEGLVAPPLSRTEIRRRGADNAEAPDQALQAEVAARIERVVAAQLSGAARSEAIMDAPPEAGLRGARPTRRVAILNVLAMTTGGQYGAFSSGFLSGWSERQDADRRPDFAVVTGASAGGIVAPIAFAGSEFDALLRLNTGIGDAQVIRRRGTVELLGASSLYATAPLQRKIRAALSDELIERIAVRFQAGNDLILGATNLDTGRFDLLEIGRIAASERMSQPDKRTCLTEAILATSAIPALFPPRRIGGHLYTDAGVRQAVFLEGLSDGVARAEASLGVDIRVNAYLIVNSDLKVRQGPIRTGLLGVAGRSFELVADEGLRASLRETVVLARRSGWRLRVVVAPDLGPGKCIDCAQLFSPEVTQALFDAGHAMATAEEIDWIGARALLARVAEY